MCGFVRNQHAWGWDRPYACASDLAITLDWRMNVPFSYSAVNLDRVSQFPYTSHRIRRNRFSLSLLEYKIVSDDKCGRQPSCADDVCVQEFLPVCGMNRDKHHHLFNNDCELRRHNCVFKESKKRSYEFHSCFLITEYDFSAYRPTALGRCKTDHQLCHDSCAAIDEPVCGQNSEKHVKIFSNTCDLDNYNCKHDDRRWTNWFADNCYF